MFYDRFGQTVSVLDLSRRKELEQGAAQRKSNTPPKGSLYDLNHVARVGRFFQQKAKAHS